MALSTAARSDRLRSDLADLVELAEGDLTVVWRTVSTPAQAREALADALPALVDVYGQAAATIAADWYDDIREQAQVTGSFRAVTAEVPADTGTTALASWGVGPLYQPDGQPDWAAARVLVAGGMQRRIADRARATAMGSALQDRQSEGWAREGGRSKSGTCAFCQMLITRGAVYTKRSVNFGAHDDDECYAVPVFKGDRFKVPEVHTPTDRNISDSDRTRVRAWIKSNT